MSYITDLNLFPTFGTDTISNLGNRGVRLSGEGGDTPQCRNHVTCQPASYCCKLVRALGIDITNAGAS